MNRNRRDILKGGGLALFGSGFLSRLDKVDGMQTQSGKESLREIVKVRNSGTSEKLLLGPKPGEEGPPEPAKEDRLPLEWNKQTVADSRKSSPNRIFMPSSCATSSILFT